MKKFKHVHSKGVRTLSLKDQAPVCEILIHQSIYDLANITKNKNVIDIGCGYGANKKIVEDVGGKWTGVEPFEGGAHSVKGNAENLPFKDNTFDIAIMDAVLEHIPDVGKAFSEVSRVLKPGGLFIGYAAFMECFHEISYNHLSFKGLEHYSKINNMQLKKISGGHRFGIDYHLAVLFYPLPFKFLRPIIAFFIRILFKLKSFCMLLWLLIIKRKPYIEAITFTKLYYKMECMRQSNGFQYIIEKQVTKF